MRETDGRQLLTYGGDCSQTILHRIYGKSMALRSFIRRSMSDMFYTFVYETESLHGVGELLEILGRSVIGIADCS